MKKQIFWLLAALITALTVSFFHPALAAGPHEWQLGFQEAASPVAERIHNFHHALLYLITAITVFVLALMLIVLVRFNAKANPKPSQVAHNTMLEVVWTVVPVLILLFVCIKSLPLLYYSDRTATPDMTLKVTGYQWYWGYEYPDHGDINFLSNRIPDDEIDKSKGHTRMLSTDNPVVLPVDTNIQLLITASDVLHAWAVPALAVKLDAVPGRANETWVRITKPGTYYGQCSELCGAGHAFMPIEIRAVSKEEFDAWVKDPEHKLSSLGQPDKPVKMANTEDHSSKSEGHN